MNLPYWQEGEIIIYQVNNAFCQAEFTLFGGHIMQWQPAQQKPVLWQSKSSIMDGTKAIRGGIPICWPWFGEIAERGKHGLVRNIMWALDSVEDTATGTRVKLVLDIPAAINPWGYPSRCEQDIEFGSSLTQSLSIINKGGDSEFAFALHSYFAVSSPANVELPFVHGLEYYDKVLQQQGQASNQGVSFNQPIDRIYHSENDALLIDNEWRRRIHIKKTHSPDTVVWNPGSEAAAIADIHPGGEREYVCVESAAAEPIKIAGNSVAQVAQTISVEAF